MSIQRFSLNFQDADSVNSASADMEGDKYGEFVRFDDHEEAVEEAVEAERERVKSEAVDKINSI